MLPTTHVKWLWEAKRTSILSRNDVANNLSNNVQLKGFIIETDGFVGEFMAEKVVMQMLKSKFQ